MSARAPSLYTDATIERLDRTANAIRQDIIRALVHAKSGHSAGPLGMADIFSAR